LLTAVVVLGFFILLKGSHSQPTAAAFNVNSPKPTGSYSDNRKIQIQPPADATTSRLATPQASTTPDAVEELKLKSNYKKERPQISLQDLHAMPLRQQLAYQFPYDPESKFPAYIWQTWKTNPSSGDFEEDFRPGEAAWTELHPTFVHEVITDDVAANLIRHLYAAVPDVVAAYDAMP
ncbi:glycosyltransferase family 32 protein, partial [Aureobasidium melanogenum]